jgi:hypothetical protein
MRHNFLIDLLIACRKCGFLRAKTPVVVQPRHSRPHCPSRRVLAIFENQSSTTMQLLSTKGLVMRLVRSIAALASVAAIGCSMFAFGWIGLALLGF